MGQAVKRWATTTGGDTLLPLALTASFAAAPSNTAPCHLASLDRIPRRRPPPAAYRQAAAAYTIAMLLLTQSPGCCFHNRAFVFTPSVSMRTQAGRMASPCEVRPFPVAHLQREALWELLLNAACLGSPIESKLLQGRVAATVLPPPCCRHRVAGTVLPAPCCRHRVAGTVLSGAGAAEARRRELTQGDKKILVR